MFGEGLGRPVASCEWVCAGNESDVNLMSKYDWLFKGDLSAWTKDEIIDCTEILNNSVKEGKQHFQKHANYAKDSKRPSYRYNAAYILNILVGYL